MGLSDAVLAGLMTLHERGLAAGRGCLNQTLLCRATDMGHGPAVSTVKLLRSLSYEATSSNTCGDVCCVPVWLSSPIERLGVNFSVRRPERVRLPKSNYLTDDVD